MDRLILNFEISGCNNNCFHCHCHGGLAETELLSIDQVIDISESFLEGVEDIYVFLVQEQTLYHDFFKLVEELSKRGFMGKGNQKALVSNCWGLAKREGFMDQLVDHFNFVKPTLFGLESTHDQHVGRKGHFNEIIEATRQSLARGIEVGWQVMLTRKNAGELDDLYQLGREMGLEEDKIFITAEYLYTGTFLENSSDYLPGSDDLEKVSRPIYEQEEGILMTEKDLIQALEEGREFEIEKVGLEQIYIDGSLNVYPISHLEPEFLLGNLNHDSVQDILEQIIDGKNLPTAIIDKRNLTLKELVAQYGNKDSRDLYTPQSLFDKLSWKALGKSE